MSRCNHTYLTCTCREHPRPEVPAWLLAGLAVLAFIGLGLISQVMGGCQ